MKLYFFAALLLMATFAMGASAHEYLQGHVQNTYEPKAGLLDRYRESSEKMGETYAILDEMLDGLGRKKLDAAQASWKNYSQTECVFTADRYRNKPERNPVRTECLVGMNEKRIDQLNAHIQELYKWDPSIAREEKAQ